MLYDKTGKSIESNGEIDDIGFNGLIIEAAIQDYLSKDEILEFVSDPSQTKDLLEQEIVEERTIVKLDKYAKLTKNQKLAVFAVARERKDPLWGQLVTVWRLERYLEAALLRKYGAEGMRRAKKAITAASAKPIKSKAVNKAIQRAKQQLNAATSAKTIKRSKDTKAKQIASRLHTI